MSGASAAGRHGVIPQTDVPGSLDKRWAPAMLWRGPIGAGYRVSSAFTGLGMNIENTSAPTRTTAPVTSAAT